MYSVVDIIMYIFLGLAITIIALEVIMDLVNLFTPKNDREDTYGPPIKKKD